MSANIFSYARLSGLAYSPLTCLRAYVAANLNASSEEST